MSVYFTRDDVVNARIADSRIVSQLLGPEAGEELDWDDFAETISRLVDRYLWPYTAVPLKKASTAVSQCAADIAACRLYLRAGYKPDDNPFKQACEDAKEMLADIGEDGTPEEDPEEYPDYAATAVVTSPARLHNSAYRVNM